MTSVVRLLGIGAIVVGTALSMTAGVAFAQEGNTISKNAIVNALKPPSTSTTLTGSLVTDPRKEAVFLNSVRNRKTRSLSMDERNQLESLTVDKPKINLEINFDYNSAEISQGSLSAVQHLGEALSDPLLRGSTFVVAGYTDATGGEVYNQDLSERRADTIKRYLVEHYHVAASELITVGYGKTHLKDAANPAAAVNRRVQIVNTQDTTASQ